MEYFYPLGVTLKYSKIHRKRFKLILNHQNFEIFKSRLLSPFFGKKKFKEINWLPAKDTIV